MSLLEVRKSKIYGVGCFTLVPLRKRRKIAAYAGELVQGKRKIAARVRAQEATGIIKVIQLCETIAIDGAVGGDATAHINHSCEPNAFMQNVPGNRVMFFALRDIAAGEEITINYRDPDHPEAHLCRCGASSCRSLKKRRSG